MHAIITETIHLHKQVLGARDCGVIHMVGPTLPQMVLWPKWVSPMLRDKSIKPSRAMA